MVIKSGIGERARVQVTDSAAASSTGKRHICGKPSSVLIEYMNHGVFAVRPLHTDSEVDRGVDYQPRLSQFAKTRMLRNDMHVKHALNASGAKGIAMPQRDLGTNTVVVRPRWGL